MKVISKAIAVAGVSSIALMLSGAAYAACTPTVDPSSGSIVVDATGCSGVQVTNAPATLSSPGLVQIDGSGNVTSDGGALQSQVNTNTSDITATNTRLNSFNGTGGTVENWASGVDSTLANYGNRITSAEGKITNLYGLYGAQQNQITALSGRMDKAYAGIAMASAFHAPQVDPGHTFGLSLSAADFAGVGGFSGAAKWRINNNFAVGAGGAFSDRGQAAGQVYGEVQW